MKELHIILHNSIPKYLDIYNQIKDLILSNKLNHNDKLISKRELAKELNCSINSVVNAYNILLDEGYIYSKEKSGYYVNNLNYSKIKPKYSIKEYSQEINYPTYDFKTSNTNDSLFNKNQFNKVIRYTISNENYLIRYKSGYPKLKETISRMLYSLKGIEASSEQIFISRSSHDLINKLINFLKIKSISIESPGYYTKDMFNIEVLNNSVDKEGFSLDNFISSNTDLAIITSFNEFPLGIKMSMKRKLDLVNYIKKSNKFIIEDSFDSNLRNNGPLTTSLFSLSNKVIYLESFTRTMFPGLCISYMVLPKELVANFNAYLIKGGLEVSTLDQMALDKFINSNYFERNINKLRTNLSNIKNAILTKLDNSLYKLFNNSNYSSIEVKLYTNLDDSYIKEKLYEKSISINFLSDYGGEKNVLIIGFTNIIKEKALEYMDYLNKCLKEFIKK